MSVRRRLRTEHPYAADRKAVQVPDLKLVDMLRTGDALQFTYKDETFDAVLTAEGALRTAKRPGQSRAADGDAAGLVLYYTPSTFTLDCVDVYWHARPDTQPSNTNPSGYERVHLVRTKQTLNQLRDEYMRKYAGRTRYDVKAPQDVTARMSTTSSSSSSCSIADAPTQAVKTARRAAGRVTLVPMPADAGTEAGKLLHHEPLSVVSTRLRGDARGYKAIAEHLEHTCGRLARTLAEYETLVRDMHGLLVHECGVPASHAVVQRAADVLAASRKAGGTKRARTVVVAETTPVLNRTWDGVPLADDSPFSTSSSSAPDLSVVARILSGELQ